jgi:hypothetical protein
MIFLLLLLLVITWIVRVLLVVVVYSAVDVLTIARSFFFLYINDHFYR